MIIPYRYQIEDERRIHRDFQGRALIAWEMGLGKTALALLRAVRHPDISLPMVVVCPASLKWNWQREAAVHVDLRAEVLEGTRPTKSVLPHSADLVVLNYDILHAWLPWLRKLRPKLIVVDESHFIASRRARRTRAVQALCKGVPHVLCLSGTPLTNRPAELWTTLNLVRPDLYPSYWPFVMRHAAPRRTPWGWDVRGASKLPELHKALTRVLMVRRLKKDVLKGLPSRRRIVVPVGIKRREYDEAAEDFLGWLARAHPGRLSGAQRSSGLAKAGYLRRLIGRLKLDAVIDWTNTFLSGEGGKVVLFACHRAVVESLKDKYRGRCVVVQGGVPSKERELAVRRFQTDKKCRVFIGNIRAAGVGITLTAAQAVAFAELDWTPGAMAQAADRIHRIGQTGDVTAYWLVAKDTIEEQILKLLQRKQETLSAVLDGKKGTEDLDVFDELCRLLRKQPKRKDPR